MIIVLVVVAIAAFFLFKGASGGPAIGDQSTLPPQMKAAYGVGGGKPPTQPPAHP